MTSHDDESGSKPPPNELKDDSSKDDKSNNPGLDIEPTLPDAIKYTGANFIDLVDIIEPTDWKSSNENDAFIFDTSGEFDGTSIRTNDEGGAFKIQANSSPSSSRTLVPRTVTYGLKIKLSDIPATDESIADLQVSVKIFGADESNFFGLQESINLETEYFDLALGDNPSSSTTISPNLVDVGNVTSVQLKVIIGESLATRIIESIEISKTSVVMIGTSQTLSKKSVTMIEIKETVGNIASQIEGEKFNAPAANVPNLPVFKDIIVPVESDISDNFGFYQKTYTTSTFNVTLGGYTVTSGTPPMFGLMVRTNESNEIDVKIPFGVILEPVPLNDTGFYVYILKNGKKSNMGRIVKSLGAMKDELKITRENGRDFKGFFNNKLIGVVTFESKEEQENREARDAANGNANGNDDVNISKPRLVIPNTPSFEIGIVYFAPPSLKVNGRESLLSSSVDFSKEPEISVNDKKLSIIEIYNLSLFYGRYGLGRTVNTFTLLPGESTEISISSSRSSTTTTDRKTTVFDKVSNTAQSELENSIESENSKQSESSESQSASASVTAGYSGFGASVSATVGASTSSSSSRQEMARNVASAVSKQASEYSAERSVEVNTTSTSTNTTNDTKAVTRKLENVNNNRTLNFVFRQLNQEYISVLHLIDIRIGYFGTDGIYAETDISGLKKFIGTFVSDKEKTIEIENGDTLTKQKVKLIDFVHDKIINQIRFVDNYKNNLVDVLVKKRVNPPNKPFAIIDLDTGEVGEEEVDGGEISPKEFYISLRNVKNDLKSDYEVSEKFSIPDIPGVIIRADEYIVRTEGIVTEAIVGDGDALDDYGLSLQDEDIREKQANIKILEAKVDLLNLQKKVVDESQDDCTRFKYFKHLNFLEPKQMYRPMDDDKDEILWWKCFSDSSYYGMMKVGLFLFVVCNLYAGIFNFIFGVFGPNSSK